MTKLKELLQTKALEGLIVILLGLLGYLLGNVWQEISVPLIQKVLPAISTKAMASVTLIAFLLLVLTWLYIFFTRKKSRKYRFDKRLGIYFHKKTGEPYCPSCLIQNLDSPLKESEEGWRCRNRFCLQFYVNPDHKSPTEKGSKSP
jgi:hypothetical protein